MSDPVPDELRKALVGIASILHRAMPEQMKFALVMWTDARVLVLSKEPTAETAEHLYRSADELMGEVIADSDATKH